MTRLLYTFFRTRASEVFSGLERASGVEPTTESAQSSLRVVGVALAT